LRHSGRERRGCSRGDHDFAARQVDHARLSPKERVCMAWLLSAFQPPPINGGWSATNG
jgi:hypothetical protein